VTWLPIRPSENLSVRQQRLDVSKLHYVQGASCAVLDRAAEGPLIEQSTFSLDHNTRRTGVIGRLQPLGAAAIAEPLNKDADDLIALTRLLAGDDPVLVGMEDRFLPPYPEAYDGLDQLVITGDRLSYDSAALPALRSWLARGGQLWIMLDRVGLEGVEALLGNAARIEIVDRVELTSFALETPAFAEIQEQVAETWESEQPVEFVRTLVEHADVQSTIDGWPAAFSLPFGSGTVTFTTLGPRGWMNEKERFSAPQAPQLSVPAPLRATRSMALGMQQRRADATIDLDVVRPLVSAQIGYRVPSRRLAGLLLGMNCLVLAGAGIWFSKRQKLEHLAWAAPLTIGVTTLLLLVIGAASTSRVPATVASFELVDISSETNEAHGTTLAGFYSPDSLDLPLAAAREDSVLPDLTELTGVGKQAIWDDDGRSQWEGIRLPTGAVRVARAEENYLLTEPLRVEGQFGSAGLEGSVVGAEQIGSPSDALMVWPPAPNAAVTFTSGRHFTCGEQQILDRDEFLTSAFLSDQQQRRQQIYRQVLDTSDGRDYPLRLTLFVWGNAKARTIEFPAAFHSVASTLYAIPVTIHDTPRGSKFLVPSSFVRMENAGVKWGFSTVYNPHEGRWLSEATRETDSMFRFVLPPQVLPCRITRATIMIRLHAPSRQVTLNGWSNEKRVLLRGFESPTGTKEHVVEDPALLQVDELGGLLFGVDISPTFEQQEQARQKRDGSFKKDQDKDERVDRSTWHIDYLRIQVAGEKL